MWGFRLIFIVFSCNLFVFPFDVSCADSVPVLLWETTQFSEMVPALSTVNQDEFRKIIQDRAAGSSPVLVFAEQTLSPEDFALRDVDGDNILASLATLSTFAQTTYWPLVKNPMKAVTHLLNKNITNTSIKELVDNPDFSVHDNDVLIIDLNDAMDGEDRLEMLKRHDKDIMEVYKRYASSNKNIITMLTSYSASWVLTDELRSARIARQAENSPGAKAEQKPKESTSKIYSNKDLMMYVNSSASLHFKGTTVTLGDFELEPDSKLDATSMNSTLKSTSHPEVSLTLSFKFGGGYWALSNITVTNTTGESYYLWIRDVYAPVGFSYHCHGQNFYNMSNSNVNLTLPGFQMQVYFNNTEAGVKRFGDAYDCVGFMSAPIWSGLFITFIMALIMTYGLSMMMDIKTMDRFDDPKGKTITINASE